MNTEIVNLRNQNIIGKTFHFTKGKVMSGIVYSQGSQFTGFLDKDYEIVGQLDNDSILVIDGSILVSVRKESGYIS